MTSRINKLKITKLEAAEDQLLTAIQLYFSDGNPASIHTLSCASYEILRGLLKFNGSEELSLKDVMIEHLKPEFKSKIRKDVNKSQNFFKHADKDPESELDFSPYETELLMVDACACLARLKGSASKELVAFSIWFRLNHPDLFFQAPDEEVLRNSLTPLVSKGKPVFYNQAVSILANGA